MKTALYVIWFGLPLFFFLMALWGRLEEISKKTKREDVKDFFNQGIFVLGCVIITVIIDQYVLASLVEKFAPEFLPLPFFEVILLPLVLLIAAKILGPSEEIRILRAPRPTESRKKRR